MRAFFLIVALGIAGVAPAWGAQSAGQGTSADSLEALLGDQGQVDHLEGRFEQSKYIADLETTLDSSGRFRFDAEQGLQWQILEPVPTQLRITPTEIIEEQDGEEVMRMDVDEQPMTRAISEVFFAIFGGDWDKLTERFRVESLAADSGWHFRLDPRGELLKSYLDTIELQGTDYLETLILSESNGDRTRIQLSNVVTR